MMYIIWNYFCSPPCFFSDQTSLHQNGFPSTLNLACSSLPMMIIGIEHALNIILPNSAGMFEFYTWTIFLFIWSKTRFINHCTIQFKQRAEFIYLKYFFLSFFYGYIEEENNYYNHNLNLFYIYDDMIEYFT